MSLLKLLVISDIHTDSKENLNWVKESLETVHNEGSFTVLIVAGDVSDRSEVLLDTFSHLSKCFDVVFFTPGNHDVWVTGTESGEHTSSLDKHIRIREALESTFDNVFCRPMRISIKAQGALENDVTPTWTLALIPLLGWHDEKFDLEPEIPSSEIGGREFPRINQVVSDRSKAKFPITEILEEKQAAPLTANQRQRDEVLGQNYQRLLQAFQIPPSPSSDAEIQNWDSSLIAWKMDQLNVVKPKDTVSLRTITRPSGYSMSATDISDSLQILLRAEKSWEEVLGPEEYDKIITFSHFLPFPFLNPEKRFLFYPYLAKVIGSQHMGLRVLQTLPDLHIFGHTHFGWNATMRELLSGQGIESEQQQILLDDNLRRMLDCRFVQAPLGYPRERKMRLRSMAVGPFNLSESGRHYVVALRLEPSSEFAIEGAGAYWSDYYKRTRRDPANTVVADYVKQIYMHRSL